MRKLLFLAVAAAIAPATAQAQAQTAVAPFFYVGAEGGADNFELSADLDLGDFDPGLAGYSASLDGLSGNGVAGGLYAGYQVPFGGGFVAIEGFGRLSSAGMKVSASDGIDTALLKVEAKETYGGAARFGMKFARSNAVYARVGWLNTRFKGTVDDGVDRISESETEDAIQYGGGLETMVGPRMSLRAEYTVSDYGEAGLGNGVSLDNGSFSAGLTFRY